MISSLSALLLAKAIPAIPPSSPPVAHFFLESAANNLRITPCSTVGWTIRVRLDTNDNVGLAGFCVDLAQGSNNPGPIDLLPAGSASTNMGNFSRPQGVSNPGPGGVGSGYGGTQTGAAGAHTLRQIGGGQNTFGVAGSVFGTSANVVTGVCNESNGRVVATGVFTAPTVPGVYTLTLSEARANFLAVRRAAPQHSSSRAAGIVIESGLTFTVPCPSDVDGGLGDGVPDGGVGIEDLVYYVIDLYLPGDARADRDDGGGTGTCDGGVGIEDLLYYLARYNAGC